MDIALLFLAIAVVWGAVVSYNAWTSGYSYPIVRGFLTVITLSVAGGVAFYATAAVVFGTTAAFLAAVPLALMAVGLFLIVGGELPLAADGENDR